MADTDYYATLGVSRTATADEIRTAHKKLSRKYHPDANQDDKSAEQKFKDVQTAYEVLSDETKRKQYDQFGAAAFEGGGMPGGFRRGPGGQPDLGDLFGGQVDLGDLFGGAFGGGGGRGRGGGRSRARKGDDAQVEITVPFTVACEGGDHALNLSREGKPERVTIKVPAGVDSGAVIRLAGQGEPGSGGGPPGDLLCTIRVAPHPWFKREGANLLVDVPVSFTEAALGGKVECPTLTEGTVLLTIPPGTASGAKLRLRGKGAMDRSTGARGDEFAVIKIVPPVNPSPEVLELLQQLAAKLPGNPREGFWA